MTGLILIGLVNVAVWRKKRWFPDDPARPGAVRHVDCAQQASFGVQSASFSGGHAARATGLQGARPYCCRRHP